MGEARDLVKKIQGTKRTFHAQMGTIKDRNGMELTEAEDIKKLQEYTEELYKKDLHDPDNHNGMITQLEPGVLECEVKWALGSITTKGASGGDGIPAELFQILKDDVLKCCTQYASKYGKLSLATVLEKVFSFKPQRRAMQKDVPTTAQLHSFHILAKYCSKFSKPGFQSTWIENSWMLKLDLEKAEKPEIKLPTSIGL